MKKIDFLSTLFVGIDVSSTENVVCAIDFDTNKLLKFAVSNNHLGACELSQKLSAFLSKNRQFKRLMIVLESTSFYSTHIAIYLSSTDELLPFNTYVYCLNSKTVANYKKSFIDIAKTDPDDAFLIADFARVGRITNEPWRGSRVLAL